MNPKDQFFRSTRGDRRRPIAAAAILAIALGGCQLTEGRTAKGDVYEPLFQTAIAAERNADYLAAASHYDKLVLKRPGDLDLLLGLARNLRYAGRPRQAIGVLEKRMNIHAESARFQLELGKARIAGGEPAAAIGHLETAALKDPKNWSIYSAMGIAYDLTEDFDKAQASYDKALSNSKDNPAVLNNKAVSMASNGDLDGAIDLLTSAGVAARRSPELRQTLALLYGIKGDAVQSRSLARIDLSEESIRSNQNVYARIRE